MKEPLRLRIHISEPFDFERENESADLYGTTVDHAGDGDEWEIDLEGWFRFNNADYDMVLLGPRYVGEHLGKVRDAILGVPVRIAHRTSEGWHYAMAGMLSLAPTDDDDDDEDGSGGAGKHDGDLI